jgi:hypothetical protein
MHNGGQTFTVLRFIAGFSKEAGSENAFSSTAGHTACFESTQMRADFSYWFGQKFDNIRLGSVSSIRIKIRSQNFYSGANGGSCDPNGI